MKSLFRLSALTATLAVILSGCALSETNPSKNRTAATKAEKRKARPADPKADKQTEARIEALTRFATGVSLDMRGSPREAIEEYRKAALADPGNEPLVSEVARRLLRARQVDKAVEVLTAAMKEPNPEPAISVLLGAALGQQGKTDEAVAILRKALAKNPRLFAAYQNLFTVYSTSGKLAEAKGVLDEAEKKLAPKTAEENFELLGLFARYVQLRPRELDSLKARALAVLERARKAANLTDPAQLLRLGDGYRAFGDLKQATEFYSHLIKLSPDLPGLREKLTESFLRADEPEKAKEQINALIKENPTNPQLYYLLGTIAAESKDADQREEKLREAAGHFERVIKLKGDFEPAYFDLAQVRMRQKDADGALRILKTARESFGNTFLVEFYTSLAFSEKKDYPAALKALTSAELIAKTTETNRITTGFYFQLGAIHERNKDFASAEKYFRKCLEQQPDFAEALNYLGYMWAERGENLKEAQSMIERALKEEPDNAAFLDSLAWVYYQQGKAKEALPLVERALKLTKEPDPTLLDHLGDICHKLGKREQAREAWKKSVALEASPAVQMKLDALPK